MTETFWLGSSFGDRKALYRVVKHLADARNITLRDLLDEAIGWSPDQYTGYQDNFRAGRVSRKKCAALWAWLRVRHPDAADRLDDIIQKTASPPSPPAQIPFRYAGRLPVSHGSFGHQCMCDQCQVQRRKGVMRYDGTPNSFFYPS